VRALRPLLEAVASLLAITLERLHYADAAQDSELQVSAERLRTSILSSLSHDLRTPLTSLVGLADTLVHRQPALDEGAIETAAIIRDQAHAMHHLMSNLLEMARLQAGSITLNKEWQPFEEIVGSSTRLLAGLLASRKLDIQVPRDLPLVDFDAVLLERVLCNLLENAVKYSPPGARIEVLARTRGEALEVAVGNDGPVFPRIASTRFSTCLPGASASRPSPVPAWGWRSARPSSRRTAARSSPRTVPAVPVCVSPFPSARPPPWTRRARDERDDRRASSSSRTNRKSAASCAMPCAARAALRSRRLRRARGWTNLLVARPIW
jgi:two-component system sensor histidine kinase KdpD